MLSGIEFDPIVVFFDGGTYWLADGFHRVRAARDGGVASLAADVRQGTKRDAILYSAGANSKHGLKRTNEDKRRAVKMLLNDEEWSKWSNVLIAEKSGVGETFVRNVREESGSHRANLKRHVGKDGKSYPSKKASAERKAPTSPQSQNGAGSSLPQNKSSDAVTTPEAPIEPSLEPQRRNEESATQGEPQRMKSESSNWANWADFSSDGLIRFALENESRMKMESPFLGEWFDRARRAIAG